MYFLALDGYAHFAKCQSPCSHKSFTIAEGSTQHVTAPPAFRLVTAAQALFLFGLLYFLRCEVAILPLAYFSSL